MIFVNIMKIKDITISFFISNYDQYSYTHRNKLKKKFLSNSMDHLKIITNFFLWISFNGFFPIQDGFNKAIIKKIVLFKFIS